MNAVNYVADSKLFVYQQINILMKQNSFLNIRSDFIHEASIE